MNVLTRAASVLSVLAAVLCCGHMRAAEPTVDFDGDVAPILAARCLQCHRGSDGEGGLNLSQRATALTGGDSGPALLPGNAAESLLWQRIAAGEMPPDDQPQLTDQQRKTLKAWINAGAKWGPRASIDLFEYSTDQRAGYDWWSLQPVTTVAPPDVDTDWIRGDIDRFIWHQLQAHQLTSSRDADPRTMVRRLYFDLWGLPPEPEALRDFVAHPTDEAYAALVDRLLASPHYGERWGRHWLDVVRFGESDGFERNNVRDHAYHYRDWVIEALNADLPYDEFCRLQLAGDLLHPGQTGAAATGFLVAGVHNTVVGSSKRMKLLARQDELEEIIGAVGQTFLGLTVNCARCHDHKFDPITAREYYQMIAAIDGVTHGERQLTIDKIARQIHPLTQQLEAVDREIAEISRTARERVLAARRTQTDAGRARVSADDLPQPIAAWTFDDGLRDAIGSLHGIAKNGAQLVDGSLHVDGKQAYVATAPLQQDVQAKTLEAWVQLDGLDQRGGGIISLQTLDGNVFDAIVFGEREPRQWMAGSDGFSRTQSFSGPEESEASDQPVHVAITYSADGTVTGYRNGQQYGTPYQTSTSHFAAGKAQVVFGLRHAAPGGNRMLAGRIISARLYDHALSADAIAASAGQENNFVSTTAMIAALDSAEAARRQQLVRVAESLRSRIAELEQQAKLQVYTVKPRQPDAMRVHIRGDVTDFGDTVEPKGIPAVSRWGADFQLDAQASDDQRRRQLAEWITHPDNGLFLRVIVNRVWHYHFGQGIVETPNDLGYNGGRPSHPDLINWLAGWFRDEGYRLKSLHRLIVTSSTYRQASAPRAAAMARDADNRLLWRYPRRRVEAEVLRDSMLAVAGQLNPQRGGPGFRDVSITYNDGTTYYEPTTVDGPEFLRRSVYRFTPRGGRSAMLDTFDCPDPSTAAPRRSVTTTPLQALSLLNNEFVWRMAEQSAERVRRLAGDDLTAQVEQAWRMILGRPPDAVELEMSQQLVTKHQLFNLCRALFNSNEFVVID